MNITVAGAGYVGLANAILLAQHNHVTIVEPSTEKVNMINAGKSPIADRDMEEWLSSKRISMTATTDAARGYMGADFVIIATPTDYNPDTNYFDTTFVESEAGQALKVNPDATIVIKSTIPVGYTGQLKKKFQTEKILFSPEFLREGKALYDCLYPSRIIVGEKSEQAESFARLLKEGALKENIETLFMESAEAEAVKLFANTFLALRVAFFNELDTYAEVRDLDTKSIIRGVCSDPRIGNHYNNPSFGYGGYCLPKDTKQLLANYDNVPQKIMSAVVEANETRKAHIAAMIKEKKPKVVGIYRLTMKMDSDNFRQSAVFDIIAKLREEDIKVIIYEPNHDEDTFGDVIVTKDPDTFKETCDIIVANRMDDELNEVVHKVYTRDLFARD